MWEPGSHILYRQVWQDRLWAVEPVTVVTDSPDLFACWLVAGTPIKRPLTLDGRPGREVWMTSTDFQLVDRTWQGTDVLFLVEPGAACAVLLFWAHDQESLLRWYLNLQEPIRRTPIGFDTMDQVLDLVISPDLTSWTWKDEVEFDALLHNSVLRPADAQAVRTEGLRILELVQARRPPYDREWEYWKPDPGWTVPGLPPRWDVLF